MKFTVIPETNNKKDAYLKHLILCKVLKLLSCKDDIQQNFRKEVFNLGNVKFFTLPVIFLSL